MLCIHQHFLFGVSMYRNYAAVEALNHGCEAVDKMRKEYRMRRDFVH